MGEGNSVKVFFKGKEKILGFSPKQNIEIVAPIDITKSLSELFFVKKPTKPEIKKVKLIQQHIIKTSLSLNGKFPTQSSIIKNFISLKLACAR
ncbi:hypothetical protein [Pseudoalteromonas sp. MTN2-4]|uniref:hypothetical protein n=1 Tax=Pseudoalteromonas sp. MTN2-4 TaxID=3056555 RepID=UPI0036F368AB